MQEDRYLSWDRTEFRNRMVDRSDYIRFGGSFGFIYSIFLTEGVSQLTPDNFHWAVFYHAKIALNKV